MLGRWVEFGQVLGTSSSFGGEYGADVLSQDLAELDAPLVKAIDSVQQAFHGNAMLINSQELATVVRRQRTFEQDAERRAITREKLVVVKRLWDTFGLQLLVCLAQSKGVRLCEEV